MVQVTSPEPAIIRRAERTDLPALIDLLHWLSINEPPMTLEQAENVWSQIAGSPIMSVWIVERGGIAVGTYTLAILPTLCHVGTPTALVESVVVAPEQRGQQLGELMMRHACTQAAAAGCYKLALSSNRRRLDAHRFYRRLGFQEHGISFAIDPSHV